LKVRLAKTLLQMEAQSETGAIDVTQHELAELLGVTRVAVAQALKVFRAKGHIETCYGSLQVKDSEALKDWLTGQVAVEPLMDHGAVP
jgi:DNA-binding FadR family transcriptional regulator